MELIRACYPEYKHTKNVYILQEPCFSRCCKAASSRLEVFLSISRGSGHPYSPSWGDYISNKQLWERRRHVSGITACTLHRGLSHACLLDCLSYYARVSGESAAWVTCTPVNSIRKLTGGNCFFILPVLPLSGINRNRLTRKRVEVAESNNQAHIGHVASTQAETVAG